MKSISGLRWSSPRVGAAAENDYSDEHGQAWRYFASRKRGRAARSWGSRTYVYRWEGIRRRRMFEFAGELGYGANLEALVRIVRGPGPEDTS